MIAFIAEPRVDDRDDVAPDFSGIDAGDLARLHELSFRLQSPRPLSALLDDVLRAAISLMGAQMGNIQLIDSVSGGLRIVAHHGFEQDFIDFFNNVHEGKGCCGTALMRGERVIVEDVEQDAIFTELRSVARKAGYRAVQSTPLRTSRGQPLGMLSTHFREPGRPPETRLRLLDLYAQQAERIIERKQADDALRAKEQQLRLVTDNTPVVIAHIGRDLRYKFVNQACARRLGHDPEYFVGKSIEDVFGKAVLEQAMPNIERVMRGEAFETETEIHYPQLGARWMRTGWTPEFGAEGEVLGWVGTALDITDRKRAERQTQQFRFAVENSTEFIGMCDLQGRPFFVNASALEMVGLDSLEQARKVEVADFFFPEDQNFILNEFFPRVLRDGKGSTEIRFRHFKTGEALWMCYNVVTLKENGNPTGFATISQNITERKRAETLLRESED